MNRRTKTVLDKGHERTNHREAALLYHPFPARAVAREFHARISSHDGKVMAVWQFASGGDSNGADESAKNVSDSNRTWIGRWKGYHGLDLHYLCGGSSCDEKFELDASEVGIEADQIEGPRVAQYFS